MGFLAGKRVLIVGLASNRSIAYGIAKAMHREGAELAFTYQNEKLQGRVVKMAAEFDSTITMPCDVAKDEDITAVFETLKQSWDSVDTIIHSVAFAPGDELKGAYLENATREGFLTAHEISSYSFSALAKAGKDMLAENGSLLTLSYLGAVRSMPNYNVMGLAKASLEANVRFMAYSLGEEKGIRVNGISAGPIRTLAASGIADFKNMLDYVKNRTPLKRNVTADEVGNTAAFLCSDLASGITGEITYVDCGFSTTAM